MKTVARREVQFGQFNLKRRERQVEGPDGPVALSARGFDILCLLIDRAGHVVSKGDIFAAVWPGMVVEENTLQVHISALRKAIGAAHVVTVHGRGYKFAGPVQSNGQTVEDVKFDSARKPVIVVLPFVNLSGDPAQQYLSDGITEDITDRLTRFRVLAIIGQHSAFAFRAETPDFDGIRKRLNADFIVTGNVRGAGDRLRISARLSDSDTGVAIWAESYDRPLADIFAVQDELTNLIAAVIARQLEIEISSGRMARSATSFACYEWTLRGNWHFNKLTRAETRTAADCYAKALAIEPRNAEAMAALACCHTSAWMYDFDHVTLEKGIDLARRASEIDPLSARSHAVLGLALCWTEGLGSARTSLDRALEINPGDWFCLGNRSMLSTYECNAREARSFLVRARALNPIPPAWLREFECLSYFPEGRFSDVLPGVEAIPEGFWDCMYAVACYGHLGMKNKAGRCTASFAAGGRTPNFMAGAAREPFADDAVKELLLDGLKKGLAA